MKALATGQGFCLGYHNEVPITVGYNNAALGLRKPYRIAPPSIQVGRFQFLAHAL
jgi:hypothetical protein